MLTTILKNDLKILGISLIVFLVVLILAINSEHRGFSHSLLAMSIEGISLGIILPTIIPSFIIAYISHLLLDVLNKKYAVEIPGIGIIEKVASCEKG